MLRVSFVPQLSGTDCGQACVAMLANTTLESAIEAVGHDQVTTTRDLNKALKQFGIEVPAKRWRFPKRSPLPSPSIVFFREGKAKYGHWVVYADGAYWDPDHLGPIEREDYLDYAAIGRPRSYLPVIAVLEDLDDDCDYCDDPDD